MADTANRNYPLIDAAAPQTVGAVRINSAINLVDADIADLIAAILLKADAAALGTAAAKDVGLSAGDVPLLDGSGKLDTSVIPAIAITEPFPVANQAAMLALTAQKGDVAIRSDLNKCFILSTNSPSTLADWIELRTPTDAVLSVAGLTGAISALALRTALSLVIGTNVQAQGTILDAVIALASNGLVARTASGAVAARAVTGTTNEISVTNGDGASGNPVVALAAAAKAYGKQAIPIPAGAIKSRTTNGPSTGSVEMSTNKNMFTTLDFDASTQEFAQVAIPMMKSWNEGTITFQVIWSHGSTTTNFGVVFELAGVAVGDGDAGDVAFGTGQTSTDTGGTTNMFYITPESSAITIAGTPQPQDMLMVQISRKPSDASDTLAVDARVHAVIIYITTDAGNDA